MLGLGMAAADVSVVLGQAFVGGMMLALPFAAFVAAGQGGTASRGRRRARPRAGGWYAAGAERRTTHAGRTGGERGPEPRAEVRHERRGRLMERPGSDAFYAAQLRRAAPIVRLFVGASCAGEKEAAYQALVRLAAAINTARGASAAGACVTPVALYRDLTRGGAWAVDASTPAVAFDARVCAELEGREAPSHPGAATPADPRRDGPAR